MKPNLEEEKDPKVAHDLILKGDEATCGARFYIILITIKDLKVMFKGFYT